MSLFDLPEPEWLPVITLWQPWASLCFTGDKLHETRAYRFPAKYAGQRVGIHAAKVIPYALPMGIHLLAEQNWGAGGRWRDTLPLGAIIGTVRLVDYARTEDRLPGAVDRICGDWSEGRFAWLLGDPCKFAEPIPAKGKQGWWRIPLAALTTGGDGGG